MDAWDVTCPLLTCALALAAAFEALDPEVVQLLRSQAVAARRAALRARAEGGGPQRVPSAKRERRRMVREMPGFLDIVTLGLSAGLSFDASLELYCDRCDTALADRLMDCMLLWRMGVSSRADALGQLADELGDPSFRRFAAAVSEALAFGTPLAEMLERQAEVLRDEQRAWSEAQIERAPVKMLIPMGTLIVPAMLMAVLGPLLAPALGMA